jgi:segregation and condensation protein B
MSGLRQQVEVLLYWNQTGFTPGELAELLKTTNREASQAILELAREYELRESGLQISWRGGSYAMEAREEYAYLADTMLPSGLKRAALRTLSAVGLQEPMRQSLLVEQRGSGAYQHVRDLQEAGFLTREEQGGTYLLRTTSKFRRLFRLSEDGKEIRSRLRELSEQESREQSSDRDESLEDTQD